MSTTAVEEVKIENTAGTAPAVAAPVPVVNVWAARAKEAAAAREAAAKTSGKSEKEKSEAEPSAATRPPEKQQQQQQKQQQKQQHQPAPAWKRSANKENGAVIVSSEHVAGIQPKDIAQADYVTEKVKVKQVCDPPACMLHKTFFWCLVVYLLRDCFRNMML
jgi:hypothetical protein